MADEENKTTFSLDLDSKEFVEKALHAKHAVEEIGEKENLSGLIAGLGEAGLAIGGVGLALFAFKETMDLVFDGEKINAINQQFELLARNAGASGEALKESLAEASGGLVSEVDLLQSANKALIQMTGSAEKLPEVLELARKVSASFGGDLLDNFENLNRAVASGSTRLLKHMGIVVDTNKALIDFARSHGTVVTALSQSEKQQALLNAVLEKGNTAFSGVDPNVKQATNAYAEMKVALKELGELIALVFEKTLGPALAKTFHTIADGAKNVKNALIADFGTGLEATNLKAKQLEEQMARLHEQIAVKEKMGFSENSADVQVLVNQLKTLEGQYEKVKVKKAELEENESEGERAPASDTGTEDLEKRKAARIKFQEELLKLKEAELQTEISTDDSIEQADEHLAQQKQLLEEETALKIQQINLDLAQGKIASAEDAARMIEEIEAAKVNKLILLEDQLESRRAAAMDRSVDESENAAEGISSAFKAGAAKDKAAINDFGALGKRTYDGYKKHASDAFKEVGAGQKSAADAAKGFIFNMIADEAEARGNVLIASSIWPPNPLGLAAGGGLLALSGFLRSQAGGGGGAGASTASAGGSGVESAGSTFGTRTDTPPTLQEQRQGKSITIQIQGHLIGPENSATLVELMRQASDATDYKYQQIGQSV